MYLGRQGRITQMTNQANAAIAYNTNKTNFDINQMSLDYSRDQFERQLAFDYDMWNKTNEYNSAAAQRSRIEAAGLNPNIMMSGGDAGSAGSLKATPASQPSMIPAQSYTVQGWQDNVPDRIIQAIGAVTDGIGKYFDVQKQKADTSIAWQDANFKQTEQTMDVMERLQRIKGLSEDNKSKILNNYYDGMSMGNRIKRVELDNNYVEAQTGLVKLNTKLGEAKLPYISEQAYCDYMNTYYDYMNKRQDLSNKKKVAQLTDAQIEKTMKETYKIVRETNNLPQLNDWQVIQLGRALVTSAASDANMKALEYKINKFGEDVPDWWRSTVKYVDDASNALQGTGNAVKFFRKDPRKAGDK